MKRTLNDFIGQERVIEIMRISCGAAKKEDRPLPHALFSGPPGLGKTSLAEACANEMNGKFVSRIATAIRRPSDVLSLFEEIDRINTVLFIDEVEQLSRSVTELMHTALEGSRLTINTNKTLVETRLPEFTMIAATNYPGELPKPFVDRFTLKLHFETYTTEQIEKMIKDHATKSNWLFTTGAIKMIAARSFGTPRTALSYARQAYDLVLAQNLVFMLNNQLVCVVCAESVQRLFNLLEVDEMGLDQLDRRVLEALCSGHPVGLMTMTQILGEDRSSIEMSEQKLLKLGLTVKTPQGRVISAKGLTHLAHVVVG
jgi:Holliday junction DNA helicase RuvB